MYGKVKFLGNSTEMFIEDKQYEILNLRSELNGSLYRFYVLLVDDRGELVEWLLCDRKVNKSSVLEEVNHSTDIFEIVKLYTCNGVKVI